MADELENRVRGVMARTFGIPLDAVAPHFKMGDHPRWDSIGHMELVAALEKEFAVRFPGHALARITSLVAIKNELVSLQTPKT